MYIKYLASNENTGRNLLSEIPAFLEYAKQQGYTKINFHGLNGRLNNVLTRYGFERLHTDNMASFMVDFYEKNLTDQKSEEEITKDRINAFEQKYINEIKKEYVKTINSFKEEIRKIKEDLINKNNTEVSNQLSKEEDFEFKERQQVVLKLKLARYFQNNDIVDTNVLFDAIIETPKFLDNDKGGLHRLLEIHEQKTLQKIAELKKERAEKTGEGLNPYEALFETDNGKYYMARLLNMPHLQEESAYMNHCVGTSDSYINKIKKGEVEILSFRNTQTIDKENNKLNNDDKPVFTIEYNLKTKTIEQMKSYNDGYLSKNDTYYNDVIESLKKLRSTKTDTNENRDFKKINESELSNFEVQDYHILTENGEVNLKDFDPDNNTFILKMGNMPITPEIPKSDAIKIMQIVEGIKIDKNELAYNVNEINENTKAYIGSLGKDIFTKLSNTDHTYTSFPDGKVNKLEYKKDIVYPTNTQQWLDTFSERNTKLEGSTTNEMLEKMDYTNLPSDQKFITLSVKDLFNSNQTQTYQDICNKAQELGLELCTQDDGPKLRRSYNQPNGTDFITAMKSITEGRLLSHLVCGS